MLTANELFKTGLGPSSSHTTGPMKAAFAFVNWLHEQDRLIQTARIETRLFGSLALTGIGHHTDRAILLGLSGFSPETIEPRQVEGIIAEIACSNKIKLPTGQIIKFTRESDLLFKTDTHLPFHSNSMMFLSFDAKGNELARRIYYTIGGGFIVDEVQAGQNQQAEAHDDLPFQITSAADLLKFCADEDLSIAELVMRNECAIAKQHEIEAELDAIWQRMNDCIENGMGKRGLLPGGLNVRRRAADISEKLNQNLTKSQQAAERSDWLNLWAMAVNEENASGGRVVTAPTNGAAGVIPAVIKYYLSFVDGADAKGVRMFLLTATAIGGLYKRNASISGAEVGCQGEVGVACSMAAAGLAAVLGGSNEQIENAAEIGMEHNLGMTCDPIGGLVQIPCIERNAFGAAMAVQAARLSLPGDGQHHVSLDKVIQTMRETGRDMSRKYKETSEGGLAVNVVEC